jgi:hypothetical protein
LENPQTLIFGLKYFNNISLDVIGGSIAKTRRSRTRH